MSGVVPLAFSARRVCPLRIGLPADCAEQRRGRIRFETRLSRVHAIATDQSRRLRPFLSVYPIITIIVVFKCAGH